MKIRFVSPLAFRSVAALKQWRFQPLSRSQLTALLCALLLALVILEELNIGVMFMQYMNHYSHVVTRNINVKRAANAPNITIVSIVDRREALEEYGLPLETVECYAALHGYEHRIVAMDQGDGTPCQQKDVMFRRHCVLHALLSSLPPDQWLLSMDADVAVLNPSHLLEEFLPSDPAIHLVLYDRIMNCEVAAGAIFARNTQFTLRFLDEWAAFEGNLPPSFHGSDNGALHMLLLQRSSPRKTEEEAACQKLWNTSDSYATLTVFIACTRHFMQGKAIEGIEIRGKTHPKRWLRDGWLTDNVWSESDFMVHGWQRRRRDRYVFARWHSPLASSPCEAFKQESKYSSLSAYCRQPGLATKAWAYKDSFIGSDEVVAKRIEQVISEQHEQFKEIIGKLGL